MHHAIGRDGFTLVEFLAITTVLAIVACLTFPAVNQVREKQRRVSCIDNLKQLVLATHAFHDAHRSFPAVAEPIDNGTRNTDGYSLLLELLPYLENSSAYDRIKSEDEGKPAAERDPLKNSAAANFACARLRCPSYAGPTYLDAIKRQYAITNYKAMSATHKESLDTGVDPGALPKYGDAKQHPDGGLVPRKRLRLRDFIDGTSNTILMVETCDQTGSYWAAGNTASLVALPSTVNYVKHANLFWAPAGFVAGHYGDEARYETPVTYLSWNFMGTGLNAGPYDASKKMTYGPSSAHPNVVNCGFCDGTGCGVSTEIDQAVLMFFVTRAGNDPASEGWYY